MPVILSQGVATITASLLCSRISSIAFAVFSSDAESVWLKTIELACSIWSLKNSPKFFIYILHLLASTTVVKAFKTASWELIFLTAFITSDNFPTPEGSIRILSGAYSESTF